MLRHTSLLMVTKSPAQSSEWYEQKLGYLQLAYTDKHALTHLPADGNKEPCPVI
jgi:hypothetical protein